MQDETGNKGGPAKPVADKETKDQVSSAGDAVRSAADASGKAAREAAGAAAEAARQQAEAGRETLEENASYLRDSAEKTAERQAEERKQQAADYAKTTAEDLRTAQNDVSNRWIAAALSQGADGFETIAEGLRGRSVREIVGQTQSFAREHPATFLTGCFAAGVALNRALRATKHQSSFTDRDGEFFTDRPKEGERAQQSANSPSYGTTSMGQTGSSDPYTARSASPYEQS